MAKGGTDLKDYMRHTAQHCGLIIHYSWKGVSWILKRIFLTWHCSVLRPLWVAGHGGVLSQPWCYNVSHFKIIIVKINFHILHSIYWYSKKSDVDLVKKKQKRKTSLANQEGKKRQDQTMDRQDQGNHQQSFSSFIESFFQNYFFSTFFGFHWLFFYQ